MSSLPDVPGFGQSSYVIGAIVGFILLLIVAYIIKKIHDSDCVNKKSDLPTYRIPTPDFDADVERMAFRAFALIGLVCAATVSGGLIREKRSYGYQGSSGYGSSGSYSNPNNFNVDRQYSTDNGYGRYHQHHYETPNGYQNGYYSSYSSSSGNFYPNQNQGNFYPNQGGYYPGQNQGNFYPGGQNQGNYYPGAHTGFSAMIPNFGGQQIPAQIPVVPSPTAAETPQFDAGGRSAGSSASSSSGTPVDSDSGSSAPAADLVPEGTTDSSLLLPSTSTPDPNSSQFAPNPPVLG
ncbi:hypothetical protein QR680_014017 [Steinernema hermaphroditum]|uniref:Uncharacterized protein n=1 Tax=Steinernema hermaphroditum TaxID=289476 RepID=A0AA39I7F0_9BILA|nr:hypothetical protein QR680_014017 [Steinernema hermaphroditum]